MHTVTAPAASPSLMDRARSDGTKKAVKYASVSLVGVATTQVVLIIVHGILGWGPLKANVIAVAISSIPSYLLNRAWVWQKRGKSDLKREVVPFWAFAFAGLALSELLVYFVSHRTNATIAVSAANLSGFGLLWVARFFVLDRLLFKNDHKGESFLEHLAEDAPLA